MVLAAETVHVALAALLPWGVMVVLVQFVGPFVVCRTQLTEPSDGEKEPDPVIRVLKVRVSPTFGLDGEEGVIEPRVGTFGPFASGLETTRFSPSAAPGAEAPMLTI
jgi:hypothetical protein